MASISIDEMMSNKNMDPKWMTEATRISDVPAAKTSKDDLLKVEFRVRMCCAKCEEKVREEASEVDGVVSVVTDQDRNKATVFGRTDSMAVLKKLKRHIDKKTTFWPPDQMQQPLSKPNHGKEASSKEDSMTGKEKRENYKRQNSLDITGTSDHGFKSKLQLDSSRNPHGDPHQSGIHLDGRGDEKPKNMHDPNTFRYGMVEPREMQNRGIQIIAATRPVQQVDFEEIPSYVPTDNIERRGVDARESTPAHQVEVEKLRPVEPTRSETVQPVQQVEFKEVVHASGPARDHSMQSRGFEVREAKPVHQAEFEKTRPVERTRLEMPRGDYMRPSDSPPDLQRVAPAPYDPAAGNMQRGPAYIREMKIPFIPGELRAAESSREAMLRRPPQYIRVMRPLDPNGMPRASHHINSRPEMREMTRVHPAAESTDRDHNNKADSSQQQSRSFMPQVVLEPKDNNNESRPLMGLQGITIRGRGPPNSISQTYNNSSTIPATAADTRRPHHHHYHHHNTDYIPVDPRDYMRMSSWESNIKAVDPRTVDPRELRGGDPADYRPAIDPTRSQLLHFQSSTPPPPPPPTTTHSKLDQSSSATRRPQRQPTDHHTKDTIRADTGCFHDDIHSTFSSTDYHVKFYPNADRLHDIPRDYQPEDAFFDDLYMRPSLQLQSFESTADDDANTTRASPQDDFFSQPITNPNYMKRILY